MDTSIKDLIISTLEESKKWVGGSLFFHEAFVHNKRIMEAYTGDDIPRLQKIAKEEAENVYDAVVRITEVMYPKEELINDQVETPCVLSDYLDKNPMNRKGLYSSLANELETYDNVSLVDVCLNLINKLRKLEGEKN